MEENSPKPIYRELKSPVTAQMALTYGCNNLCRYCYNSTRGLENQDKGMSIENSMKIAKQIVDNEIFEVVLTGGRAIVQKRFIISFSRIFFPKEN